LMDNLEGAAITEPRNFPFRTGRREKFWHKNCVAIGLSAGFMEPLESTSIHLIQTGVVRLAQMFPATGFDATNIEEFNRQVAFEYERVRDFIILHYKANQRTDSAFWPRCREMAIPESLAHKMRLFEDTGLIFRENNELFSEAAWLQVMIGQGIMPKAYSPLADSISDAQLNEYLANLKQIIGANVPKLPDQREFIARHCAAS